MSRSEEAGRRGDRGGGQEVLEKWTVCTINMLRDKNAVTPNNLLSLICGTIHYKNTNKISYCLCTEHGIIQSTMGREQLDPLPHMDAKGLGINYTNSLMHFWKVLEQLIIFC